MSSCEEGVFYKSSEHGSLAEARDLAECLWNYDWCTWSLCDIMPTARECLCCQEMDKLGWIQGEVPCITQHEEFSSICLNPDVLQTAAVTIVDVGQDSVTEPLTHRLASVCLKKTADFVLIVLYD